MKKYVKIKFLCSCNTIPKDNVLQFNQYIKTDKISYIKYAVLESLINKIDECANKNYLYHGEDCMKRFCSSLRKHATNVINFENTKVLPLTRKELKLNQD